ncbi:MAG: outer membrane beta-barrel protein [Ignavibacteria bacterium]
MHRTLLFIFLSIIVLGTNSFPQTFGIGGGLSIVTGPDTYTKSYNSGGVGYSDGYHFGAKLKIDFPLLPITPVGFVTYSRYSGDELTTNGTIRTSQSIWSIGAGGEYELFLAPSISPYIAADLSYNNFGDFKSENPVNEIGIIGQSLIGGSKVGGAIGIGAEVIYHFDLSIKYQFLNWIGKEPGEETVSVMNFNLTLLIF